MSGGCGAVPGGSASCSGNGVCVNNSVCVCNSELFTGLSDWVNAEGRDCQIVQPVIWAFWAINLLLILAVTARAAPVLRRLWLHHSKVRERQRQKGNKYSIRTNLGLASVLPYWFVSLPTHVAVAIMQLAQRDARLGLNLALTILWMLSRISNDLSASASRTALTISTMQSAGASPVAIHRQEVIIWVSFILSAASSFMVWPVYATQGTDLALAEGLFVAHFVFAALFAGFNAHTSHRLGASVHTSLTESFEKLKDERILQVRDDLTRSQRYERNAYALTAMCYLCLGAIPPLWTTHDYFWCVLWLMWPLMGLNSVLTLESAQKSARGEKERDKLLESVQNSAGGSKVRRGSVTAPIKADQLKNDFMSKWNNALGISMRAIRTSHDPEGS